VSIAVVTPMQDIDFAPATVREEIIQNVRCIIATAKGTVPLDRDFGTDFSFIDKPAPLAQMQLRMDVIAAVEKYEPRAHVRKVEFSQNADAPDGQLIPVVTLEIDDAS